jgi:hypothetical protein
LYFSEKNGHGIRIDAEIDDDIDAFFHSLSDDVSTGVFVHPHCRCIRDEELNASCAARIRKTSFCGRLRTAGRLSSRRRGSFRRPRFSPAGIVRLHANE